MPPNVSFSIVTGTGEISCERLARLLSHSYNCSVYWCNDRFRSSGARSLAEWSVIDIRDRVKAGPKGGNLDKME